MAQSNKNKRPPLPDAADADMTTAAWHTHLGAAAEVPLWTVARRIPAVVAGIVRMCWRASSGWTVTVLVAQILEAVLTGAALAQGISVLGVLFTTSGTMTSHVHDAIVPLIVLTILYSLRALAGAAAARALAVLQPRVLNQVQTDNYQLTMSVALSAHDDTEWSEALHRCADYAVAYSGQAVGTAVGVISSSLSIMSASGVLAYLHPLLLPIMLISVLPAGFASVYSAREQFYSALRLQSLSLRQWMLTWYLTDSDSAAELRACNAGPMLFGEYQRMSTTILAERVALGLRQTRAGIVGRALSGVGTAVVYAALLAMLAAGWLPLARGAGAVMAIRTVSAALAALVLEVLGLWEQSMWLTDLEKWAADTKAKHMPRITGILAPPFVRRVDLVGVEYTYPGATKPALTEVNLSIRAGQVTALVGYNGAGKTTLVKILAGLIDPTVGQVEWDGQDVAEFDAASVAGRVAMCPQDPTLWPLSIMANVAVCEPHPDLADDARAKAAADLAGAAPIVEKLELGWDTPMSRRLRGGVRLSGGQRGRMAIARSLYRQERVSVLVLDEPTAQLDPIAEAETYAAIMSLRGREDLAVVVVSHRLGAVVNADVIYVFDDGRLAEAGTHAQLLANQGPYWKMFAAQSSMYVPA